MKKGMRININLLGGDVKMELVNVEGLVVLKKKWEDKRNLSDKLLSEIDKILKKNGVKLKDIEKINFECDSPYFCKNKKNATIELSSSDFSGKCSFTAWQAGEVMTKVMNFILNAT